ncbi:MAG: hypothetical protein WD872_16680 [Pirellulaceae bacterium]
MQRTLVSLVLVAASGSLAGAQEPHAPILGQEITPSVTPATVTPEMWFYSQEVRRQDDPKVALRRRAEYVAQQRQMRIAAMKWYGLSNSRPSVSANPHLGVYSPAWVGNGYDRYDWVGGYPRAAIYVVPLTIQR